MKKFWITIPLASLALTALSFNVARAAEEDEAGGESSITLKQTPRAVRYTLLREADGADINGVDKEKSSKGKITYEADVIIDGTNYEIDVDPSGLLLSKAIDKGDSDEAAAAKGDKDDAKGKQSADADDDDDKPAAKGDQDDDSKGKQTADADDDDDKPAAKADKDSDKSAKSDKDSDDKDTN